MVAAKGRKAGQGGGSDEVVERILKHIKEARSFDFAKRWYFPGGQVNAMRIYLSPLH